MGGGSTEPPNNARRGYLVAPSPQPRAVSTLFRSLPPSGGGRWVGAESSTNARRRTSIIPPVQKGLIERVLSIQPLNAQDNRRWRAARATASRSESH